MPKLSAEGQEKPNAPQHPWVLRMRLKWSGFFSLLFDQKTVDSFNGYKKSIFFLNAVKKILICPK
jgi:hypothetical protein